MHQKGVKMTKIVPIRHSSDQLDIADALDGEIDTMWGLVACLQTIYTEHRGDPFIRGALRLANAHIDGLSAIRRDLDRLPQSA